MKVFVWVNIVIMIFKFLILGFMIFGLMLMSFYVENFGIVLNMSFVLYGWLVVLIVVVMSGIVFVFNGF